MPKRLIFNADDYGRCVEINDAVEELIEAKRLNDVSVLANGEMLDSAADFLLANPQVSAGIHLNAVEGKPISSAVKIGVLIGADGEFAGLGDLMLRWIARPFAVSRAVEIEWRAQIEKLLDAKLSLSHADSHQHLHAFPPAWHIAVKLCREYGIAGLRLPRERNRLPKRQAGAFALSTSLAIARLMTSSDKLHHNDHMLGFKRAGAYELNSLIEDLRTIPAGLTEIALHPSTADKVPYSGLSGNRERQALLDSSLPERLEEMGIELTSWKMVTEGLG
ncbi:MAG: ChbG/HpnK family deacetylase [Acidobacteria bacterium]|nr:ChbG/HpnK family deacetylase [Acidobacteriota bacterium]